MHRILFLLALCGLLMSSGDARAANGMNEIAERYAHLVLALGQHDPDYVDAFYGPAEWKTDAEKEKKSLDEIAAEVGKVVAALAKIPAAEMSGEELDNLRREYLQRQIFALEARVAMLKGGQFKFDAESRALYDAVAPTYPDSHFDDILAQLEKKIPASNRQSGSDLWQRYEEWRKPF